MTSKTHDLVVKVGEYQVNGETKSRYENIGSMMQGDKGPFLILKRTFNPAGVVNPENRDSLIVSCFEPQQNKQQAPQQHHSAPPMEPAQAPITDFDDDIPFADPYKHMFNVV